MKQTATEQKITRFFDDLGAPLTNMQWSWGAVRSDGAVFVRVWEDEITAGRSCYSDDTVQPTKSSDLPSATNISHSYAQVHRATSSY
jgi:hypothetical protein